MTIDTTFDRLRRANPFPDEVRRDDELFARIVAQRGDARPATGPRRRIRRRTLGLAIAFVAIALGSSTYATVHFVFGEGVVGAATSRAEYLNPDAAAELPRELAARRLALRRGRRPGRRRHRPGREAVPNPPLAPHTVPGLRARRRRPARRWPCPPPPGAPPARTGWPCTR